MRQLFCDLDGVLADFDRYFFDLFGIVLDRTQPDPKNLWKKIASIKNFYANLPMMPDAALLWTGLRMLHPNPIILTGVPSSIPDAGRQKVEWVHNHLGNVQVICCASKDKCLHGQPGDVLVDDWTKYRHLWETMGGVFVLHTSAKESLQQVKELYS